MNTLGELLELGQGKVRTLDSILVVPLPPEHTEVSLTESAKAAQKAFPETQHLEFKISQQQSLSEFVNQTEGKSVLSQLIFKENDQRYLAFKMSHKVGDGLSMFLWLRAQLFGEIVSGDLKLKKFPAKKDTPYRWLRPSLTWPRKIRVLSDKRGFVSITLKHREMRVNDQLTLGLLKVLGKRSSVWLPINIRENPRVGFGNALSRVRIYPPQNKLSDREAMDFIARQKKEAMRNGEVFSVPDHFKLDTSAKKFLFKAWLNRPWADWCSISFSHMTKTGFSHVRGIPPISPHHAAVIFAVTEGDETFVTLTFDEALVSVDEAQEFLLSWQRSLHDLIL